MSQGERDLVRYKKKIIGKTRNKIADMLYDESFSRDVLVDKNVTVFERFAKSIGDGEIAVKAKQTRVKPVDKRKASRNLLNEKAKSISTDVIKELGLKMYDRNFNPTAKNFVWIMRRVSKSLNSIIGISTGKRKEVTNEQYSKLEDPKVLKGVLSENLDYFKKKLAEKKK